MSYIHYSSKITFAISKSGPANICVCLAISIVDSRFSANSSAEAGMVFHALDVKLKAVPKTDN